MIEKNKEGVRDMKNPKRNPVERFCALLLAFIMVFTLVLPDGALSVSAAGNNSDEASGEPEASTRKRPMLSLRFLKRFRQQKIQITKLQFKVQICRLKRQAQTM